ncbi:MAG: hypothetical protein ACYDET_00945 [Thermoleophilia bacterium]
MKFSPVEFSVRRPVLVIIFVLLVTAAFATQFPRIKTDTDPNNMLPENSDVRLSNRVVEQTFGLHKDMVAVAIVNGTSVFNPATVNRIVSLIRDKQTCIRDRSRSNTGSVFCPGRYQNTRQQQHGGMV